jgi:hypothetical protein
MERERIGSHKDVAGTSQGRAGAQKRPVLHAATKRPEDIPPLQGGYGDGGSSDPWIPSTVIQIRPLRGPGDGPSQVKVRKCSMESRG